MDGELEALLRRLAVNDERAVESVLGRPLSDVEDFGLDPKTRALVQLSGLIAAQSPPASFQWSVAAALGAGASEDDIVGVLSALGAIVGTARMNWAAPEIAGALGYDLDLSADDN